MASVAERIKQARQEAGLTQKALADRVGVSRRTVLRWEDDTEPQASEIARIAKATDRPIEFFFIPQKRLAPNPFAESLLDVVERAARAEARRVIAEERVA